jgi:hypothetical protein
MKKQLSVALALVSLAFVPVSSQAYTVNLDGTTATGIDDLEIGPTSYDVTFLTTSANALYGANPNQIFPFPDQMLAERAVVFAVVALNDSIAEFVGSTADSGERQFNIGWGVNDVETGIWTTNATYLNNWLGPGDRELVGFNTPVVYADFNVAVIPVPAAVWLFGSALGVLGWLRRKAT